MKRRCSLILAGIIPALLACAALSAGKASDTVRVCFQKVCVRAEVADSDPSRIRGLMFREKLKDKEGMLFVFPVDARHSFWMKNMRFALDIIWIDRDKTVVDIEPAAQPCTLSNCRSLVPQAASRYVLEVPAGFTRRNRITIGNHISFSLP